MGNYKKIKNMKNLVMLSLFFLSLSMFGQEQPKLDRVVVRMWAIDSKDNIDSIIFGYDKNATNGIDTQLGEKDILEQVYNNTLELRGFQRKSENQICGGSGFDSDTNFDTKINFRDILYPPNIFEFIIKGKNYPIQIYADFKEMFDSTYYNSVSQIYLYDSLCNTPKVVWADYSEKLLFSIDNEKQYLIKVNLNYIFDGLSEINSETSRYNIFPTFVTDNLTIESKINNSDNFVEVYNSIGRPVIDKEFSTTLKLDLKTLKQGIYFVRLKSANRTETEIFKITKK